MSATPKWAATTGAQCIHCRHPYGVHGGRCHSKFVAKCKCPGFEPKRGAAGVWFTDPAEDDPDRAWDDYKTGYSDIDGNVLDPPEPS